MQNTRRHLELRLLTRPIDEQAGFSMATNAADELQAILNCDRTELCRGMLLAALVQLEATLNERQVAKLLDATAENYFQIRRRERRREGLKEKLCANFRPRYH